MKYLLLVLLSLSLKAELDLTIPEQPAVYVSPKEFSLNLGDYNEPPTRNQMIFFWTINAFDVYTTYKGVKKPDIYELNPLLPKKPKLQELLLQKAIIAGYISQNSSKNYITVMNTSLTLAVISNYNTMK
tara:strand:+ start:935 stop:1321 length:387 start_codon:yes stop_codon:yes gene_type:complete